MVPPVKVVGLDDGVGGAEEVLRATVRGEVVKVARVLGHLWNREDKIPVVLITVWNADMALTFMFHCLVGMVAPVAVLPNWKQIMLHASEESRYTGRGNSKKA